MDMVVNQYEVFLIDRPCVIISPDEMNHHIGTVIVAPMTTKSHEYPTRISLKFQGKKGWIILDQLRTIDKVRLVKKLGNIESKTVRKVKEVLREMLVD